jgi:two-component system chemotaxis response regulator CheY
MILAMFISSGRFFTITINAILFAHGAKMAKTVLIVDDSSVVRQVVSYTLSKAGYELIVAVNGKDALTKLPNAMIAMVITDLNMPEMNGIELIRELRKRNEHKFTPIVMLTTVSEESRKQEGKEAGASGWIFKPFTSAQLMEVVNRFIT